jgi:Fe-S-cluster containining protein
MLHYLFGNGTRFYELGNYIKTDLPDDESKPCRQLRWDGHKAVCIKHKSKPKACREYSFSEKCHLDKLLELKK